MKYTKYINADENSEAETAHVVGENFMAYRTIVALPRANPWSNYLRTKHARISTGNIPDIGNKN